MIIHSHGHLDHIGGANFFKKMFGTKLYLGEPDARMFRERPWISAIYDAHSDLNELFVPDYEIKEGDVLTFGNTTMRFTLVPGHTDGCIAIFFDAHDGEETKRCGYYGGFGFNTLQKDYLIEIGDPEYKTRQTYRTRWPRCAMRRWRSSWATTASTTIPWGAVRSSWTTPTARTPSSIPKCGASTSMRSATPCWSS